MADRVPVTAPRLFAAPPPWWITLAILNVLLFIPGACMNHADQRRHESEGGSWIRTSSVHAVPIAFEHGPAAGFEQLTYALAEVFGTFIFCAAPALLGSVVNAIGREWLRSRSWMLCFLLTLVAGYMVKFVADTP